MLSGPPLQLECILLLLQIQFGCFLLSYIRLLLPLSINLTLLSGITYSYITLLYHSSLPCHVFTIFTLPDHNSFALCQSSTCFDFTPKLSYIVLPYNILPYISLSFCLCTFLSHSSFVYLNRLHLNWPFSKLFSLSFFMWMPHLHLTYPLYHICFTHPSLCSPALFYSFLY